MLFPKLPTEYKWYRILIAIACKGRTIPTNREYKGKRLGRTIALPHTQQFREGMAKEIASLRERPYWEPNEYFYLIPPELVFLRRACKLASTFEEKRDTQLKIVSECLESPDVTPEEWINHYNAVHNIWNAQTLRYRAASKNDNPFDVYNQYHTEEYIFRKGEYLPNQRYTTKLLIESQFLFHPVYSDHYVVDRPATVLRRFRWKIKKLPPDPQNFGIESKFRHLIGREYES